MDVDVVRVAADLVGKTLGEYQVVEEIGQGGMALVYKAWQAKLNRYVALKVRPFGISWVLLPSV